MRNVPLKGFLKKSPMKKDFDYSKKADYSKATTSKTVGAKIAKAIVPENTVKGVVTAALPVGKVVKAGKAIYNYFTS